MYDFIRRKQFRKDYKRVNANPEFDCTSFEHILALLMKGERLERRYDTHILSGKFKGCFECHVQPNTLLIYAIDHIGRVVYLHRIGSHAELFR